VLHDFRDLLKGRRVAPVELQEIARKALHFVGYQGLAAASGLNMAAWDALAKAAGPPHFMFLGGTVGPVKAYNSNGLWLRDPEQVTEEAIDLRNEARFHRFKLRLGRENARDDLRAIHAVRVSVGDAFRLMVDFNQGLDLSEALHRCHAIDDLSLEWVEPIVYDNFDVFARLSAELDPAICIGRFR
jgi:mandelate racemase